MADAQSIVSRLEAKYPQLVLKNDEPSEKMLRQAIECLIKPPSTHAVSKIAALADKLCGAAVSSDAESWVILPRGGKSLKALRLLIDRLVESGQDKELKEWLGSLKPSEVSAKWFEDILHGDGAGLPTEIRVRVAEWFVLEQKGAMAFIALVIVLLEQAKRLHANNSLSVEEKRIVCREICTKASQSPLKEHVMAGLDHWMSEWASSASVLSTTCFPVRLASPERAKDLIAKVDWVGFDLDFTLIDFHEDVRVQHLWSCVHAAIEETLAGMRKGPGDPLPPRVEQALRNARQPPKVGLFPKCCVLDVFQGNVLQLDDEGNVVRERVYHGTRLVPSTTETEDDDYAEVALGLSQEEGESSSSASVGPKRFVVIHTHMEMPLALGFAQCVDEADALGAYSIISEEVEERRNTYLKIMDVLRKSFVLAQSPFFPNGMQAVYRDPSKLRTMLRTDHSKRIREWLLALRTVKGKRLFLLTDAREEHVDLMLSSTLGEDWQSIFNLIVVDAKKATFFDGLSTSDTISKPAAVPDPTSAQATRYAEGKVCRGGAISEFDAFVGSASSSQNTEPKILYFGDHALKDVTFPNAKQRWKTIAVIAEMDREPFHIHSLSSNKNSSGSLSKLLSLTRWTSSKGDVLKQQPSVALTRSKSSTSPSSASSASSFQCADGVPTLLSVHVYTHAEFCVPSVRFCALNKLFL